MTWESHVSDAELTDEDLMLRISSSTDRMVVDRAFDEVFTRYHQRVVAWCYRVTRNHDSACDLAQEVFLKAFRHSASFRGDSRLSTWLYAITRNHCLSALKRQPEEALSLDAHTQRNLQDDTTAKPGENAERIELCHLLLRLMDRTLEPIEVRVMTLHYAHDIPLATITHQLSLSNPSGAKAYIVNARRKLNGVVRRRGWNVALMAAPAQVASVPGWPVRAAA